MLDLGHVKIAGISGIPPEEFAARKAKLDKILSGENLEGMIFFSASSIYYLTGSSLIQTERPMVFIYKPGAAGTFLVPLLEEEHVLEHTKGCKIAVYKEFPDEKHPMRYLPELLKEMKLDNAAVAADSDGAPGVYGYRGPKLSEVCPGLKLSLLPRVIEDMKIIKSPFEQELLRESARWGHLAHTLLQKYTKPGLNEMEVSSRAGTEATATMLKVLGPRFRLSGYDGRGAFAGFRGQIGPHSYFPHSVTTNAVFVKGDMLVTGASASILGYGSELERVMFVGEPGKEQRHYCELTTEAGNVAFSNIKPGKKCSEVDREVRRFFADNNLSEYWRHHTGHAIGTGMHERPFFDVGDETVLEPGMCMTVEPGIYVKGLGGFRHSDTVIVTKDGCELITYYTREIDELVCARD